MELAEGTLILPYTMHMLGPFLGCSNFEFQHFRGGGGVRKMRGVGWDGGMMKLWIFLGGHGKTGLFWGVIY